MDNNSNNPQNPSETLIYRSCLTPMLGEVTSLQELKEKLSKLSQQLSEVAPGSSFPQAPESHSTE